MWFSVVTEGSLDINMSFFFFLLLAYNHHETRVNFSLMLLVIVYYIQGAKSTLKIAVFTLNFIAISSWNWTLSISIM